ncbi:MAG: tRNA (5-methylaminomethyl-2-thiouridine)(34)-methyltransferase MnmD [Clostridiales bacterium]|nr:tRNA (5-methylaminomethyl-2-thiouridine)(34)-methyltransferase MnmD [Clostridiales bacterium]
MDIPSYLVNEHFDDRYFDVVNAMDEAQQIHFRNNDLLERISRSTAAGDVFAIGETGFGAGRNVISLMEFLEDSGLNNVVIEYNSVELYPMSAGRMLDILQSFRERAGERIDLLVGEYRSIDINAAGWHEMKLVQSYGEITVRLWIGEALEMVRALDKPCEVWFLDGHSPKKNPEIWRPELLSLIGEKTKTGGGCTTFTVSGAVKRALEAAGFSLRKHAGCGGKNEVLQGLK